MESNLESGNIGVDETQSAKAGIWSIIVDVFSSPAKAFAEYSKAPRIIVPLIVIIVLSAVSAGLTTSYQTKAQYDLMKSSTVLPAQALEQMRKEAEEPNVIKAVLVGPIVVIIIGVLSALLAWFLGIVVFGGTAKFKVVWGVELLAGLIVQLGQLIRAPMAMAKGDIYVTLGLAAFMPDKDFTSAFYSLMYYLDAFAIWAIIVAGIGYAVIFGISRGKGYAVSAITSVLLVVVMVTLGFIGMSFAGVKTSFF